MASDFEHMSASHGGFVSFWLAAVAAMGVAALCWVFYLGYQDWRRKRLRRGERRQKRTATRRRRKPP